MIKIYTDGSSKGNPGKGGFGVAIFRDDVLIKHKGCYFDNVTNNQMELQAILYALKTINKLYSTEICEIYCDSAYCVNICNSWIKGWAQNNWTRGKGEEIKNLDIIKEIYAYLNVEFPNFVIKKCGGHSGNLGNELADALATNNQAKFAEFLKRVERNIENDFLIDFL